MPNFFNVKGYTVAINFSGEKLWYKVCNIYCI